MRKSSKNDKKKTAAPFLKFYKKLSDACDTYDDVMKWYDLVNELRILLQTHTNIITSQTLQERLDQVSSLTDTTRTGIEAACTALQKDLKGALENFLNDRIEKYIENHGQDGPPLKLGKVAITAIGGGGAALAIAFVAVIIFTQFDFDIYTDSNSVTIVQGKSVSIPLEVRLQEGDSQTVNVFCLSVSPMISCSIRPEQVKPTDYADVIIEANAQTVPSSYSITITGQREDIVRQKSITVFVEAAPLPQLNIRPLSPKNNAEISSLPIILSVAVSENPPVKDALVEFFYDNKFLSSAKTDSEGFASASVVQPTLGLHSWYAKASKDGYKEQILPVQQFSFIDKTSPTLTINSPKEGQHISTNLLVEGTSFDGESGISKIEVRIDDGIFELAKGTSSWTFEKNVSYGPHVITVRASDMAGNSVEKTIKITAKSNFGATIELDQQVYTWTDKVSITIIVPDLNNPNIIDSIGDNLLYPITISTRNYSIKNYQLEETGVDTGIFTGEVILTGFLHDADGNPNTGDASGFDTFPRTNGNGPTNGFIQTSSQEDDIIISFKFDEDKPVVSLAPIRWNIGEVSWDKVSYPANGMGIVRVVDPDMNLNPEVIDNFRVNVWSDTDAVGISLLVTETNKTTGIFEGTVFFTTTDISSENILLVSEGDTVTAKYKDKTLPTPYTMVDEIEIIDTTGVQIK